MAYRYARRFPKPLKELLLGLALGGAVIVNGFRNGGKSEAVRKATRALWFEVATQFGANKAKSQFEQLRAKKGLKIHLGCGSDIREGWVNVDAFSTPPSAPRANTNTYVIQYDLRQEMPFQDGCSTYIYSSHFWEHLPLESGYHLFEQCYRWLETGGTFRIVLPDLGRVFKAYLEQDRSYFDLLDQTGIVSTPDGLSDGTEIVDFVNYAVYQKGEHKYIYDVPKLTQLLRKIGYSSVEVSSFDPSVDVNTPLRTQYSFYVEAVK